MRPILLGAAVVLGAAGLYAAWALLPADPLAVPERGVVLLGVTVIEPTERRRSETTLRIEGTRIAAIEAGSGGGPYAGHFVLPGLSDLHTHVPPDMGFGIVAHYNLLYLAYGVTAVRNAGDLDGQSAAPSKDGVANGDFPGPRHFGCGPFVDGPDTTWPNSRIVRSAAEGVAAVDAIAAAGFDCVKAYNGLNADALRGIRTAAKRHGLPVIGHVPRTMRFEEALLDDTQHLSGIAVPAGEPTGRFPENQAHWATIDEARIRQVVQTAVLHGSSVTPTLVVMDRFRLLDRREKLVGLPEVLRMPRLFRDVVWATPPFDPKVFPTFAVALRAEQELTARLHRAGVPVHVGTDALTAFGVPAASVQQEMRLLVEAGIPTEEVWALATRGNGAALPLDDLGRIRVGAPADLLVFRDDPTRSLEALDSLVAVIADGRLYTLEVIETQLEASRHYHDGWLFDTVSVAAGRAALQRVQGKPGEGTGPD